MGCMFIGVEKIEGRRGENLLMGNYVQDPASESGHETDPYEDYEIYSIVTIGE